MPQAEYWGTRLLSPPEWMTRIRLPSKAWQAASPAAQMRTACSLLRRHPALRYAAQQPDSAYPPHAPGYSAAHLKSRRRFRRACRPDQAAPHSVSFPGASDALSGRKSAHDMPEPGPRSKPSAPHNPTTAGSGCAEFPHTVSYSPDKTAVKITSDKTIKYTSSLVFHGCRYQNPASSADLSLLVG